VKRRSYRTVLDILFHAMVRYAAPVLVFTAEEVWGTRFPNAESVHLLEWPILPTLERSPILRHSREGGVPTASLDNPSPEPSSQPDGSVMDPRLRGGDELVERWTTLRQFRELATTLIEPYRREKKIGSSLEANVAFNLQDLYGIDLSDVDLAELLIVSSIEGSHYRDAEDSDGFFKVTKTNHHKCGRCWRHLPEVTGDGALCGRCEDVLNA
jgi:isoleucyl-tRNA synthetase